MKIDKAYRVKEITRWLDPVFFLWVAWTRECMMVGKREGNLKLTGDINHVAVDTKQETGRMQW